MLFKLKNVSFKEKITHYEFDASNTSQKRKNTLRVEKQKTEKVSGNKKKQLEGHFPIGNGPVTPLGLKKEHLKAAVFPKSKNG